MFAYTLGPPREPRLRRQPPTLTGGRHSHLGLSGVPHLYSAPPPAALLLRRSHPIKSLTPVLSGPTEDFEGFAEGTMMDTQVPAVTFSQAPFGGRPMIDNYPFLYAYVASSGVGVLTGSTEGGYLYPTVAGIVTTFDTPQAGVQAYLSDTTPLGDYVVAAYDSTNALLESLTVYQAELNRTTPGWYVGFSRGSADITSVQFGPSNYGTWGDAFCIDDLTFSGSIIPLPGTASMLAVGLVGLMLGGRRR